MKKYNSEACEAIYEEVMAEFKAGLISEAEMREYGFNFINPLQI
jgi:DNA-binding transcriptional regulator YiaG